MVIQSKLPYATSFDGEISLDTLYNFSPNIRYNGVSTLYFHDIYQKAFKKFFSTEDYQKATFIATLLKMSPGAIVDITTQPDIYSIRLNSKLDSAVIHYRLINTMMKSTVVKKNKRWKNVYNEDISIE